MLAASLFLLSFSPQPNILPARSTPLALSMMSSHFTETRGIDSEMQTDLAELPLELDERENNHRVNSQKFVPSPFALASSVWPALLLPGAASAADAAEQGLPPDTLVVGFALFLVVATGALTLSLGDIVADEVGAAHISTVEHGVLLSATHGSLTRLVRFSSVRHTGAASQLCQPHQQEPAAAKQVVGRHALSRRPRGPYFAGSSRESFML